MTMDIHRCRFVPYRPHSINSLEFSHPSNPKRSPPKDLRLAVARENGDIEIWNPLAGAWLQEKILRGSRGRTVEQLVWTQDLVVDEANTENSLQPGSLRLFSNGGSPSITEWDLTTGQQKKHAESPLADIWCFAAQPQWKRNAKRLDLNKIADEPSQLLAAGCSDGSIKLFTTADDSLQYWRPLTPASGKKAKVISITWRDRNTVVAGYENGTIQIIDVPSRTIQRTMSLGKSSDGSAAVVWTLKCLNDGTILSGDSSGELKIWDGKTLALTQKLKAHDDVDVLDITASDDCSTIFSAGIDRKVCVFKQLETLSGGKRERWQKTMHRRFHEHDVKALASFEAKGLSVLVSGGIDTVPIVMPLRNWDSEFHRSLSHLPQKPQMSCSSGSRLMLTWWGCDLFIWNLPKDSASHSLDQTFPSGVNHQLLARVQLSSNEHITSAQISGDGRMFVTATAAGVKLFQIRKRTEAEEVEVRTRQLDLPVGIRSFGASIVGFSPDSKWLYAVRASNLIAMIKITAGLSSKEKPLIHQQTIKLERRKRDKDSLESRGLGTYLQSINSVSFSSDSRIMAVGDLNGAVDTWLLEGHEDLHSGLGFDDSNSSDSDSDSDSESDDESDSRVIHGQKWIRNPAGSGLPRLDSAIIALGFKPQSISVSPTSPTVGLHATRHNPHPVSHELPSASTRLIAVTASHQIVEFDIMQGRLSDWSRRNPSNYLPQSFTQIKDRAMGIFWDCKPSAMRERLWLYGPTWLFMLDMTRDLSLVDAQDKIGRIGDYDVREPLPDSTNKKRENGDPPPLAARKKRKRNTGAGDSKYAEARSVTQTSTAQNDDMEIDTGLLSPMSEDEKDGNNTDDGDSAEPNTNSALTHLRRQNGDQRSTDEVDPSADSSSASPSHHTIYRYRSIFGIAALEPSTNTDPDSALNTFTKDNSIEPTTSSSQDNLEIILVERPMYDVDLMPRFDSGQDWAT